MKRLLLINRSWCEVNTIWEKYIDGWLLWEDGQYNGIASPSEHRNVNLEAQEGVLLESSNIISLEVTLNKE